MKAEVGPAMVAAAGVPLTLMEVNWLTKPVPVKVILGGVPPARTLVGVMEAIVGTGSSTFKGT